MSGPGVEQMVHGYVRGHELLAASVRVSAQDQDEVTRLSDLSGNLLGDEPPSYLTAYPLPSGDWYALARTWPDTQAARRGCVVTRTALVPMDSWRQGVNVEALAAALLPVDRSQLSSTLNALTIDWKALADVRPLPTSIDLQLDDFVHRLFLEPQSSIVWPIEPPQMAGVELLTLRLLKFLWPARRATASICTFALQPRQVSGTPFEVLFAPAAALSRFRASPQQIIGGDRPKVRGGRGEHVVRAVRQVLNGQANSEDWQSYSAFAALLPNQADALLRLATLDDLARRSDQGPNALLAALDVWAGLAQEPSVAEASKREVAAKALARADQLPTGEGLSLLAALLQRLLRPPFRSLGDIRKEARSHVSLKSAKDVAGAIEWTVADGKVRKDLTRLVARGIGGAATSQMPALGVLEAGTELVSALLAEAPALPARYLSELPPRALRSRLSQVEAWIESCPPAAQSRVARELVQSAAIVRSEPLASLALEYAGASDVARFLNAASEEPVTEVTWGALQQLSRRFPEQTRRHYLAASQLTRPEARLLAQALDEASVKEALDHCKKLGATEGAWLALEYLGIRTSAQPLFLSILRPSADRELAAALWRGVLAGVAEAAEGFQKLMARAPASDVLSVVGARDLLQPESAPLRNSVLTAAFNALLPAYLSGQSDGKVLWAWAEVARELRAGEVFDRTADRLALTAGSAAHPERVWLVTEARLALLPNLGARPYADRVQQAIALTRERHTPPSVEVWHRLVVRALELSREHREGVGLASFDAAVRSRRSPVSPILVATFPVLHGGLPGRRRETMFVGIIPLPYDIDKKKDARRQLVDAFLQSTWPPGDLAIAAHRAGVLPKIVARLRQLRRADYIQRMGADLGSRSNDLARVVAAHLHDTRDGDDDS